MSGRLTRIAPGLLMLARYRRQDFPHDLRAGLSVAAVALPVGVAYAALAGFSPVVGLYASILPLFAYALFGSSRQLVVGPDAATCTLVAASVAPLAAGDAQLYMALSLTLAFLAGVLCIGASLLKLGVLADFLSRPILVGFMNGIALTIALGQLGKILGFPVEAGGIVPRALEIAQKIGLTHWPTLAVGLASFVVLLLAPKVLRRVPAALVVMVLAAAAVAVLGLDERGVRTVGEVPAGLPALTFPGVPLSALKPLLADAAGIALIAFTSLMLTSRSFAAKNGYEIDADRDLAALGAANIAASISGGFAVSGADSRTAMSDAAGGRTQVAGLVAAMTIALVLLFLTGPLQYVPDAALGAVLVMAAFSLVDIAEVRMLWHESKSEFAICLVATLGVVAVGAIDAIAFAVILAMLRFVRMVARPTCEVLGRIEGKGFHSIERHAQALTVPGLCLFRFNGPVVFFNAPYFRQEARHAVEAAGAGLRFFVIDAIPITGHDVTGRATLRELDQELLARGVQIVIAGRETELMEWREKTGMDELRPIKVRQFPTLAHAVDALQAEL
ncbi:MAG: SulP family inorganic anion transporter [Gammaproteobacteria bacterium]|nr:SulP family inorganic anion transporter [Gammaproteobacteria bacterium]